MVNGKAKGARIEREAAQAVTSALGVEARRSQQYCGAAGDADITTSLPGVSFEVKARKSIGALRFMDQARDDAAKVKALPVVLMRENGDTAFYALLRLEDLPEIARRVLEAKALAEIRKAAQEPDQ